MILPALSVSTNPPDVPSSAEAANPNPGSARSAAEMSDALGRTDPGQVGVWRLAWRISQHKPKQIWLGTGLFVLFFCFPALTGYAISLSFSALADGDTEGVMRATALLVAAEVARMTAIYYGVIWFIRAWVMMQSLMQSNMLQAQVVSGGPEAGRPAASPGAAVFAVPG